MDRKCYLLTFLLFYLCSLNAVQAADEDFPLNGGTTSEGITISNVKFDKMKKMDKENSVMVQNQITRGTYSFDIKVPSGKAASLKYTLSQDISPMNEDDDLPENSEVSFTVKVGDKVVQTHRDPESLCFTSEGINIPSGTHHVVFIANFNPKKCFTTGTISDFDIHIHRFDSVGVTRQPLCGLPGESYSKCSICKKDTVFATYSEYDEHNLITLSAEKKLSCLSNAGTVSRCEHCPYSEIKFSGKLEKHDFDDDDICKVCHMHMPKLNSATNAYEVYDAAEMRILAEMLSLGLVDGNFGIDIKADLVFSADTTMLPLGTYEHPFQGTLNGNGHRIKGVAATYLGTDCLGFVGVAKGTLLSHAVIANLIFDGENSLRGQACVGGIVGYAENCDIVNCGSFGALEGNDFIGGIVGYADQQVSILNCAAVTTIRSLGKWNTIACSMPMGHILNSYGAATNDFDGVFSDLPTATLRHCFSSQGSCPGLTQVSQDVMASVDMVQLLNEESETPSFMMGEHYPIPTVNTTVQASSNRALPFNRAAFNLHRAEAADADPNDDNEDEKDSEVVVSYGYVDDTRLHQANAALTIAEVMSQDSVKYDDFNRVYVITRDVPEGFGLYEAISGGNLKAFEAYYMPADTSYAAMTQYSVVGVDKVKAVSEVVSYKTKEDERIEQYSIDDVGNYTLTGRLKFLDEYNMIYEETVDGVMKPVWNIETKRDDYNDGRLVSSLYTYDKLTGASHLEYSHTFGKGGNATNVEEVEDEDENYEEIIDKSTNTIHIYEHYVDPFDGVTPMRDHYILRAVDQYLMEFRTEKMTDGEACLVDGMFFMYDYDGALEQTVAFAPVDPAVPNSEVRPYLYHEYVGRWVKEPFPTSIRVPSVQQPSVKKRMDTTVYDARGRKVRQATDMSDPFAGLPRGIYIYQGAKYLKR